MGASNSSLAGIPSLSYLSSWWRRMTTPRDIRVLVLGLDNAGKTTILYRLKDDEVVETVPTVGFNLETITIDGVEINVWDLGGQTSIRPYWRCYYSNTAAIVFVVDSTDVDRFETAQTELVAMLSEPELRETALLVLANKRDLPGARPVGEICEALKLNELRDRNWTIMACSAFKDTTGMSESKDWLSQTLVKQM